MKRRYIGNNRMVMRRDRMTSEPSAGKELHHQSRRDGRASKREVGNSAHTPFGLIRAPLRESPPSSAGVEDVDSTSRSQRRRVFPESRYYL